jgi:hypothetical protein
MAINIGIPADHSATYAFWKKNQREIIDKHIDDSLQAFKLSGLKFSEEYEEYVKLKTPNYYHFFVTKIKFFFR